MICPKIIWQIDDNWFGSASYNNPAKGVLIRRIQFLVGQPTWHMQKVARSDCRGMFSAIAPTDRGLSFEHIDDRVLFSVVVNAGFPQRLDLKDACP